MAEAPRRQSKLGGSHPAVTATPVATPPPSAPAAPAEPKATVAPVTDSGLRPPMTQSKRRVHPGGPLPDTAMVSFNCKMMVGLRRETRKYAADCEVDIQDVVAAALTDYLTARGINVPQFGSELR